MPGFDSFARARRRVPAGCLRQAISLRSVQRKRERGHVREEKERGPQGLRGCRSLFGEKLERLSRFGRLSAKRLSLESLQVLPGAASTHEYGRFGTTAGHGGLDDSDSDGRSNLLELAFDTDPTLPDGAANPAPVVEGGFLTITLNQRAGVTYTVQTAGNPAAAAFSAATTTVLLNNVTTLKVRDNFPIASAGHRFMRVLVTAAP